MSQATHDIMSKKLVTIPMSTTASKALQVMEECRIRHLPVVDEMSDVVGVVTKQDLVDSELFVELFMSSPVEYLDQGTPLQRVIFRMLEKKISCILVGNDKEDAIGIVTTSDLLWYLAYLLGKETEEHQTLWNIVNLRTIGDVTRSLADIGI